MNMRLEIPSMHGEQSRRNQEDSRQEKINFAVSLIEEGARKLLAGQNVDDVIKDIRKFAKGQKLPVDLKNYELLKAVGNSGLLEGKKQEEILKVLLGNSYGSYIESKKAKEEEPLELTDIIEETAIKTRRPEDPASRKAEGLRKISFSETVAEFYADVEITVKKIGEFEEKFLKNGVLEISADNDELNKLVAKIKETFDHIYQDNALPDAPAIIRQAFNAYNNFVKLLEKSGINKNI